MLISASFHITLLMFINKFNKKGSFFIQNIEFEAQIGMFEESVMT